MPLTWFRPAGLGVPCGLRSVDIAWIPQSRGDMAILTSKRDDVAFDSDFNPRTFAEVRQGESPCSWPYWFLRSSNYPLNSQNVIFLMTEPDKFSGNVL